MDIVKPASLDKTNPGRKWKSIRRWVLHFSWQVAVQEARLPGEQQLVGKDAHHHWSASGISLGLQHSDKTGHRHYAIILLKKIKRSRINTRDVKKAIWKLPWDLVQSYTKASLNSSTLSLWCTVSPNKTKEKKPKPVIKNPCHKRTTKTKTINAVNQYFYSHWLGPLCRVSHRVAMPVYMFVPSKSKCNLFQGLSLALRSHDQFIALSLARCPQPLPPPDQPPSPHTSPFIVYPLPPFSKHRPSGPMLSISQFVRPSVRVSVCSLFEVPFNGLFAPTSQSRMSNIFRDSESVGKSNGKKWSQIWTFLFKNCLKSPRKKKFFSSFFFGLLRFSVFF